jgi:predicted kinase
MGDIVIMRGPSGSSKSTYVSKNFSNALVCSADHYFTNELTGEYKWSADKIGAAHFACKRKFTDALTSKIPLIVIDNTNITNTEMKFYVSEAKAAGYHIRIIRMEVPLEKLYGRNTHNVPNEVVKNMYAKMQTIPSIWGITEEVVKGY